MKILAQSMNKNGFFVCAFLGLLTFPGFSRAQSASSYIIPDTAQIHCFDNTNQITHPDPNTSFYGQDAQYNFSSPAFLDNGNGTVTDLNTNLTWQKDPDLNQDGVIDIDDKLTFAQAQTYAAILNDANYCDYATGVFPPSRNYIPLSILPASPACPPPPRFPISTPTISTSPTATNPPTNALSTPNFSPPLNTSAPP